MDICITDMQTQVWSNDCFTPASLSSIGLVFQLGHYADQGICALPSPIRKGFMVVDTSGIHLLSIRFCGCCPVGEDIQLLRYRWYPASSAKPRTAFTLDLLNTFHLITLQGKLSAYDFYLAIHHKTNNVGAFDDQVCSSFPVLLALHDTFVLGPLSSIPHLCTPIPAPPHAEACWSRNDPGPCVRHPAWCLRRRLSRVPASRYQYPRKS